MEGIIIEQLFLQKIEKVKDLMVYYKMNLSEIAYQLGYRSVAHLSAQFKKVTGLRQATSKNLAGHSENL